MHPNILRIMKTLIRSSVLFCLLGAFAFAADAVKVAGSRELRLAVVDTAKSSATRETAHAAFAASFSEAIAKLCGEKIGVKVKCVSADHAAFNLGTGVYDAVLVLGTSLPRPLMISDVSRLSATLGAGKTERKAYLIFNNSDEGLAKVLAGSFEPALTSDRFLDALDGKAGQLAGAAGGSQVAAAP